MLPERVSLLLIFNLMVASVVTGLLIAFPEVGSFQHYYQCVILLFPFFTSFPFRSLSPFCCFFSPNLVLEPSNDMEFCCSVGMVLIRGIPWGLADS